jgi:hypothetical protein
MLFKHAETLHHEPFVRKKMDGPRTEGQRNTVSVTCLSIVDHAGLAVGACNSRLCQAITAQQKPVYMCPSSPSCAQMQAGTISFKAPN